MTKVIVQSDQIDGISKTVFPGAALCLSLQFFCCVFSGFAATSFVSLGVFLCFLLYLVLVRPNVLIKYLPFSFAVVANVLGVYVCETASVFLDELAVFSCFHGSLPILAFSRSLFFVVLVALEDRRVDREHELILSNSGSHLSKRGDATVNWATAATLIVLAVLFSQVAAHPSFMEGLNRFTYATSYGSSGGIYSILSSLIDYIFVFPVLALRYGKKKLGAVGVGFYVLYLIWTGTKFGSLLTVLCVFAFVYYDKFLLMGIDVTRKFTLVLFAAILGLVGFSLILFSFTTTSKDPIEYFNTRIAEQGQLWWAAYPVSAGNIHLDEFGDEVSGTFHGSTKVKENIGANYGIYKMMYLVAPEKQILNHLTVGARYTEGGYANAYYYLGVFGPPIYSCLMAIFVSVIVNALVSALTRKSLIESMLLLRLMSLSRAALGMALFVGFFDKFSLVSYAFLLIAWSLRVNSKAKQNISQFR